LAALQALDDEMPGCAQGDAAVRMYATVKQIIEESPDAKITSTVLRKIKFKPSMVACYLEFVAPALGQKIGENGHYQLASEAKALVLDNAAFTEDLEEEDTAEGGDSEVEDESLDDDEIDVEKEPQTEATEITADKAPARTLTLLNETRMDSRSFAMNSTANIMPGSAMLAAFPKECEKRETLIRADRLRPWPQFIKLALKLLFFFHGGREPCLKLSFTTRQRKNF